MEQWWQSLTDIQQFFAIVGIPATLILFLQTLLLLFGLGGHGDDGTDAGGPEFDTGDADGLDMYDGHVDDMHDGVYGQELEHGHEVTDHGVRLFSVRTLVAFFTMFGWTGLVLTRGGLNEILSIFFALIVGLFAMFGIAYLFKVAMRLQTSGNIDSKNALGKSATVYIPIPAARAGTGKVTLLLQGRFIEKDAVTELNRTLKTGEEVIVVAVSNQEVLCVAPKAAPQNAAQSRPNA